MKNLIFIFVILSLTNCSFGQNNQLTKKQKEKDFIHLYNTMKENYPFFGFKKRKNGFDWLEKKDEYIRQLTNTKNDSIYILTLKKIIDELNDGHFDLSFTRYGNYFHNLYKKVTIDDESYSKWVDVFDNPKTKIDYWSAILKNSENRNYSDANEQPAKNYSDTIINNQIAIMDIRSFYFQWIEPDKNEINDFLHKINDCKYLIIDIQENQGGSTNYWKRNIVERLINDTLIYTSYPFMKDGEHNRYFYSAFFDKAEVLKSSDTLKNIPSELLNDKYYLKKEQSKYAPNNPVNFKGEIFLLVSKKVFSSAEGFAQFCKTTDFATVIGETTGGDGIGSDPLPILLPESGIIVRYPAYVGLNHDGSINAEVKTVPDIEIKGENSKERLNKLIKYLTEKK